MTCEYIMTPGNIILLTGYSLFGIVYWILLFQQEQTKKLQVRIIGKQTFISKVAVNLYYVRVSYHFLPFTFL